MSKEFIQAQTNKSELNLAATQERQLSYHLQSSLQEDNINQTYLTQWAERNYSGNDYFLNYIKSVFKIDNFLMFYKYLRKPLPSTKLINNKIKPQLNRVFVAENADYKYDVTGVDAGEIKETLHPTVFQEELFENILFNHNSILIEDLKETNEPFRFYVDIKKVVSLNHDTKRITQIAFPGCITYEDKEITGYVYIDDFTYKFYNTDYTLITEIDHDLGVCPADFITKTKYKGSFIVRESLFTYIREELEEYNFLKTLQKMTEPNGAIPVVSKLDVGDDSESDIKGSNGEPSSDDIMGSQRSEVHNTNNNKQTGELQPGTIHGIPLKAVMSEDGTINMDLVTNYLNFFYTPIEALDYIKTRIIEVENSIISTIVGNVDSLNEQAVNELQIKRSVIALENSLIWLANNINYIRTLSDTKMLGLKYGIDRVNEVFIFTGTDFFLESESSLYDNLGKAPNPIERKTILVRINQNKYKNNKDQMIRSKLLYDLLPYTTDEDFDKAVSNSLDEITKQYYLRFNYWIGLFEAQYGDIVSFYMDLESDEATRLALINNLIIEIIKTIGIKQEITDNKGEELTDSQREDERIKIEAQSKLKGTVGGVDGILAIQAGVGAGTTQYSSALEILQEIYGFSEEQSKALLGRNKEVATGTNIKS